MEVYKYNINWSRLGKKNKFFASIENNKLELFEIGQVIDIEDIIEVKVLTLVSRSLASGNFVHSWIVKTRSQECPLVFGFETKKKELKRLLLDLKRINPNIYYNTQIDMFINHKVYDRTVRKNMFEADSVASFRNPQLDTALGLLSVFLIVAFITGMSFLLKNVTLGLFDFNEDYRIMFTFIGSLVFSLALVNEGIAPFVGSYLGLKKSLIVGIIGLALMMLAL